MIFFVLSIFDGVIMDGHPIFSVVDARLLAGIRHDFKYWMPIHYDTIKDGQNKKSHLLFSFLVRIVSLCILSAGFICQKYYTSFLLNDTPHENKCFIPRNQNHRVTFFLTVNSICVQMPFAILGVHACMLNTQVSCVIADPAICLSCSNGWEELWP